MVIIQLNVKSIKFLTLVNGNYGTVEVESTQFTNRLLRSEPSDIK